MSCRKPLLSLRIFSESIQTNMKALYQHYVKIWIHWMNQKQGVKKFVVLLKMAQPLILIWDPFCFRASMIWIIGEYAERIDNADELLESFLEGFADENSQVQLQLLTAIVKLFLKRPADTQELVQQVLSLATQVSLLVRAKFLLMLQLMFFLSNRILIILTFEIEVTYTGVYSQRIRVLQKKLFLRKSR